MDEIRSLGAVDDRGIRTDEDAAAEIAAWEGLQGAIENLRRARRPLAVLLFGLAQHAVDGSGHHWAVFSKESIGGPDTTTPASQRQRQCARGRTLAQSTTERSRSGGTALAESERISMSAANQEL